MKIGIDSDEWYPVYFTTEVEDADGSEFVYEVPEAVLERWDRAAAEFDAVQSEMGRFVAASWKNGKRVDPSPEFFGRGE